MFTKDNDAVLEKRKVQTYRSREKSLVYIERVVPSNYNTDCSAAVKLLATPFSTISKDSVKGQAVRGAFEVH